MYDVVLVFRDGQENLLQITYKDVFLSSFKEAEIDEAESIPFTGIQQ